MSAPIPNSSSSTLKIPSSFQKMFNKLIMLLYGHMSIY